MSTLHMPTILKMDASSPMSARYPFCLDTERSDAWERHREACGTLGSGKKMLGDIQKSFIVFLPSAASQRGCRTSLKSTSDSALLSIPAVFEVLFGARLTGV